MNVKYVHRLNVRFLDEGSAIRNRLTLPISSAIHIELPHSEQARRLDCKALDLNLNREGFRFRETAFHFGKDVICVFQLTNVAVWNLKWVGAVRGDQRPSQSQQLVPNRPWVSRIQDGFEPNEVHLDEDEIYRRPISIGRRSMTACCRLTCGG
jgi:hypothetical protein